VRWPSLKERIKHGKFNYPLYEIGYGTCEESQYWQFQHQETFTDKQLRKLVRECIFEVLSKLADAKRESNKVNIFKKSRKPNSNGPQYNDVMDTDWFHKALKKRGFVRSKYTATCSVFGWANCLAPSDWKSWTSNTTRNMSRSLKRLCKNAGIYVKWTVKKHKSKSGKGKFLQHTLGQLRRKRNNGV